MNLNDVKDFGHEIAETFRNEPEAREALEDLKRQWPQLVVSTAMMLSARRARKAGNWNKAIYLAILWAGLTNNYSQAEVVRQLKLNRKARNPFSFRTNSPFLN
jgi:hypothetical protein